MDDLRKKHLQDILIAIEEIESFFGDKPKLFEDFYSNLCLRRAIERNIEIIGEAMNRILKTSRNIAITNSRKIVDARNYIIHGYDSLSADILWSMVINHLPKLKNEVTVIRLKDKGRRGYMLSIRQVYIYNSLLMFNKHLDILFSDIDLTFLRRYETWLRKQGLAENTIGIRFRTLRAVYNLAIEQNLVKTENSQIQ